MASAVCGLLGRPDPDAGRLYFGKSFMYPLVAAPFVWALGTNGFLVLHALLLALAVLRRTCTCTREWPQRRLCLIATAFVMATVVPVYFVWITPELFNFSMILFAVLLLALQGGRRS